MQTYTFHLYSCQSLLHQFKKQKKMEKIQAQLNRIERLTLLGAKKVLTFEDVALLTGLSKSYLYKLTSANQIPFYRPTGKQLFFDREEIENWLKQNKQEVKK